MKRNFLLLIALIILTPGCTSVSSVIPEIVYKDSRPQKAIIYNNGEVVLEETIEGSRIVHNSLLLPMTLNLKTVSVSRNNERLTYYTIEKKQVAVQNGDEVPHTEERYVLAFPDLDTSTPLLLRYSVVGISREPRLDIEIQEGGKIRTRLNAVINPGRNQLESYNFKLQPDAMPGEYFLWRLKLAANDVKEIAFDFDSDDKSFSEYRQFDYYEGGR